MFRFHKYLTAGLAITILALLGATAGALFKLGLGAITQPIATLIGVILVPSITLLGFLVQKRIERNYEVSKEARNAAREFIDASTAYLTSLMQSDFGKQVEKFQAYQSKWFQLHTVMPEVFSGKNKKILEYHYEALTAIQTARNSERRGESLDESEMRKMLFVVRDSEAAMVSTLTSVCTGVDVSSQETKELIQTIIKSQFRAQRYSRGNVAIQLGAYMTDKEMLIEVKERLGATKQLLEDRSDNPVKSGTDHIERAKNIDK